MATNYMLNGNATIILLADGLKKRHNINEWIFPKLEFFGERVKVELDLSSYATKVDLKNTIGFDTSKFAKMLI